MTCCIAALAAGGEAIVLVADKMIGNSVIQGEPQGLLKYDAIHRDWWVMFAGDVPVAGDLIGRLKAAFPKGSLDAQNVDAYLSTVLFEKWRDDTERAYLRKEGYDHAGFRDEAPKKMLATDYADLRNRVMHRSLYAELIVAGFDGDGNGHILSCSGLSNSSQFVPSNHDMSGYYAIGTGAAGAMWMMSYKDVGSLMDTRDVAYYAVEGKYYGELGEGVGECTDLIVLRHNKKALCVNTRIVEKHMMPICDKLRPRKLGKKERKRLKKVTGQKLRWPA